MSEETLGMCERCGVYTVVTLEEYKENPENLWYLCDRCKEEIQNLEESKT